MKDEGSVPRAYSWRPRFTALADAQSRYFYVLGIAGVFFYALFAGLSAGSGEVSVKLFQVEVSAALVLAVGPAVLGFLIQAVTGAIVATDSAAWRMAVLEEVAFEREHTSPSAVDLAFYTTDRSPIWVRALRLTVYPAYLTAFLGEGGFLAYRMLQPGWWTRIEAVDPSPTVQWLRYPLLVVGVLLLLCALPRLGILWWRKIAHATMMLRNKNTPVQVSRAMSILADITDTLRGAGRKVESRVARGYYTLHVDDQTVLRSRSLQGLATRTREWYKTQPAETPSDGSKSVTR